MGRIGRVTRRRLTVTVVAMLAITCSGVVAEAAPAAATPARSRAFATPAPTAYVANLVSNTVTPIATATNKPGKPIKVGNYPAAITITPNGRTAYIPNAASATPTPITTANDNPST